jgi:hypothetical protein
MPDTNAIANANDSIQPPTSAEQLAFLKSGGYRTVQPSPQWNYFYKDEEEDNEWNNDYACSRSDHEYAMSQVILIDKYSLSVRAATSKVSNEKKAL